MTEHLL